MTYCLASCFTCLQPCTVVPYVRKFRTIWIWPTFSEAIQKMLLDNVECLPWHKTIGKLSAVISIHVHVFPWHEYCIYFHVGIYTYTVHVLIYIFISFFQNPHIRRKEWDGQMCVCMAYPFNRKSYTFDNDTLDLWQRSFKTLNEGTNPLEKRGKHLWIRMLFELWIFGYFKEKLITRLFIISLSSQSKNYAMKKRKKKQEDKINI